MEQEQHEHTQHIAQRYVNVLLWPVLAAALFQIAGVHTENSEQVILFTNVVLVIAVVWKAYLEQTNWQTASVVGAICGSASAFILALYLLVSDFHVVRLFNIVTETAITGVLMCIATGFAYSMVQLISARMRTSQHSDKGGDIS
jgi:glucose-6-phosphate-specific signal transduction histidine kinase